jgi:hypothetical protein
MGTTTTLSFKRERARKLAYKLRFRLLKAIFSLHPAVFRRKYFF